MISKASLKYVRISPVRVRQVINIIRGKSVINAMGYLSNINKRPRIYLLELLKSALSNAKHQHAGINESDLFISTIRVDNGPMLKRFRAASMGSAVPIIHRTSHITVELDKITSPAQELKDIALHKTGKMPVSKRPFHTKTDTAKKEKGETGKRSFKKKALKKTARRKG